MPTTHAYDRWLYRGGHPNLLARALNRGWAVLFGLGVWPSRMATLEVAGRRSGRTITLPVVIAEHEGERYLVSMLGDGGWVRNVRAAQGLAVLRHGRREAVQLDEIDVADRPAVLKRYLAVAPGARAHIPVDRDAPVEAFEPVAASIPVFRITAQR
jgi:deazaflavin-dependent oxidoreductase (nitroreductase family)